MFAVFKLGHRASKMLDRDGTTEFQDIVTCYITNFISYLAWSMLIINIQTRQSTFSIDRIILHAIIDTLYHAVI